LSQESSQNKIATSWNGSSISSSYHPFSDTIATGTSLNGNVYASSSRFGKNPATSRNLTAMTGVSSSRPMTSISGAGFQTKPETKGKN